MGQWLLRWLMIACCSGLAMVHAAERLRIATEGAYPPFSFINAEGQLAGFDVDIAQELCIRLRKDCEIIAVPWAELLPGLAAGRYEVIVASMAKTPEREQQAEFTDAYYHTHNVFVGRPQYRTPRVTVDTVRGKTLATQAETTFADYLRHHYQEVATLKLTPTLGDAFAALQRNEVDLVLSDNLGAFEFLRSDAGQAFDMIGEPLTLDGVGQGAYLQVRKGHSKLRDAINAALRDFRLDGTYHRINARYFPFDIY